MTEMTYAKGMVGEVGYERVSLVVSNAKQPFPKLNNANKEQTKSDPAESRCLAVWHAA